MQKLEPPDSHFLDAAIGWIGLGCITDANAELGQISNENQLHPTVLQVRWNIYAHEKRWKDALAMARALVETTPEEPSGWLHRAYALRRVNDGGLTQAWDALLPAAEKFPTEPVIAYNLSCYACQMQQLEQARLWLKRAIASGEKRDIIRMALADDDLKPLWAEIREF